MVSIIKLLLCLRVVKSIFLMCYLLSRLLLSLFLLMWVLFCCYCYCWFRFLSFSFPYVGFLFRLFWCDFLIIVFLGVFFISCSWRFWLFLVLLRSFWSWVFCFVVFRGVDFCFADFDVYWHWIDNFYDVSFCLGVVGGLCFFSVVVDDLS